MHKQKKQAKFPILVSYAYFRKLSDKDKEWWVTRPNVELLLDSGAFTAWSSGKPILIEEYISFLKEWGDRFWNYMALDVVAKPRVTRRNLGKMWKAGLDPVPVFVFGEDKDWMNVLYQHRDYVAFPPRQQMGDTLSFVRRCLKIRMDWAEGRKVHWFGWGSPPCVSQYHPYSCDTTDWFRGLRWGWFEAYLGNGRWYKHYNLIRTRNRIVPQSVMRVVHECGFSDQDFYDERLWSETKEKFQDGKLVRCVPRQITLSSWIRYSIDARKNIGTRVFLALPPSRSQHLNEAFHWIHKCQKGDEACSPSLRSSTSALRTASSDTKGSVQTSTGTTTERASRLRLKSSMIWE